MDAGDHRCRRDDRRVRAAIASRATRACASRGWCSPSLVAHRVGASRPPLLLFVPPAALNVAFGVFFGVTLAPGREPRIATFARLERGELPPDLRRYTRRPDLALDGVLFRLRGDRTAARGVRAARRLVGVRQRRKLRRGGRRCSSANTCIASCAFPTYPHASLAAIVRIVAQDRRSHAAEGRNDERAAVDRRLRARMRSLGVHDGRVLVAGGSSRRRKRLPRRLPDGRMRPAAVRRSARVRARVRRDAVARRDRVAAAESGARTRSTASCARARRRSRSSIAQARRSRCRRSSSIRGRRPRRPTTFRRSRTTTSPRSCTRPARPATRSRTRRPGRRWSRGARALRERIGFRAGRRDRRRGAAAAHVGTRSDGHAAAAGRRRRSCRSPAAAARHRGRARASRRPSLAGADAVAHPELRCSPDVQLPPLAGVLTATSALERDVAERFERATGAPTIEIYGVDRDRRDRHAPSRARCPRSCRFAVCRVESRADGLRRCAARSSTSDVRAARSRARRGGRSLHARRPRCGPREDRRQAGVARDARTSELLAIDGVVDGAFVVARHAAA